MRITPFPALPTLLATAFAGAPGPANLSGQDAEALVEELLSRPAVQAAMEHIESTDERTMQDLVELTQIPAPPFMETERGERFAELLVEAGIDSVYTDREGNVIGVRRGRNPDGGVLALSGHLDTVFPEGTDVQVQVRGDTLAAPGIADDTRGLATVLAVLRAMNATDMETEQDVLFIGTVGEEGLGDLRGMKHLFRDGGPRIDAFISVDGTGSDGITSMGLGSHRYRITYRGPGGHSWGAFGLGNPAHALGRAIHYFDEAGDEFTGDGPRTSYNVGRIGGGTSVNSVPFEAWMEIDMRSESPESLEGIDARMQEALRRALEEANAVRRRGDELTLDVEMIGDRPSGAIAQDEPFIEKAVAATEALGHDAELRRSSTDSNIPIAMGIPAITIGGGGVGVGAHSLHEYFINRDGPAGIQRVLLIVLAQAGLAAPVS
jgi:acetylornithine deacetylase/succinyl-diaminopimelate desuccinylase-like protein